VVAVAEVGEVGLQGVVGLAGDVALEAADDLAFGLALLGAARGVGLGASAIAQAADEFGTVSWPRFGGLIWLHLRPIVA